MTAASSTAIVLTVALIAVVGGRLALIGVRAQARSRLRPVVVSARPGAAHAVLRWFDRWRRRHDPPVGSTAADLAATLDTIARRCSSGDTLSTALVETANHAEHAHALVAVARAVAGGASVHLALAAAAGMDAGADVAYAVHVLRLCADHGGNIGEALDRAAATLRERHTVAADRVAQGAQARLSAKVLTVLPMAFAAWTLATSADVRAFTTTAPGVVALAAGMALNLTGWRWMQRTIRGTT
jgi:Flp pilus assembly protein TadB